MAEKLKTVVILVHGIRTHASWFQDVPNWIPSDGSIDYKHAGYDYLDAFKFWFPFFTRQKALEKVEHKIGVVLNDYPPSKWRRVIIAHSFGTYASSIALQNNPHWKFDDLILCGSIIPSDFNWTAINNQISGRIINDCGRYDIWPIAAKSLSWGYGNTGSHGAHHPHVVDRFFPFHHSGFFNKKFVSKYWGSYIREKQLHPGSITPSEVKSPFWLWLLEFPWKWPLVASLIFAAILVANISLHGSVFCYPSEHRYKAQCVTEEWLAGRKELSSHLKTVLENMNATLALKNARLFPLMRRYEQKPSEQLWAEVSSKTKSLLQQVQGGLETAYKYDSTIVSNGRADEIRVLVSNGTQLVGKQYSNPFNTTKKNWQTRSVLANEIIQMKNMPTTSQMEDWHKRLLDLHSELKVELNRLIDLLDDHSVEA